MNQNYTDRRNEQLQRQMQQTPSTQLTPIQQGLPSQVMPMERQPTPTTLESSYYTAGLLRSFIGERMRVQFLVGTSGPLIDMTGTLVEVGANYIILRPIDSDDLLICDLYSIKFVTVIR